MITHITVAYLFLTFVTSLIVVELTNDAEVLHGTNEDYIKALTHFFKRRAKRT